MERRKDTPFKATKLPKDYLELVEGVFNKNFAKHLMREEAGKECFQVRGELYKDELLLAVSLKRPGNLRMTTCYASIDYPPPLKKEDNTPVTSASDLVQGGMNQCVDVIASFFNTFFEEGRPVDYDLEYRQNWTLIEPDKMTKVYLLINRDNLELEAQADALLQLDADDTNKKKLH